MNKVEIKRLNRIMDVFPIEYATLGSAALDLRASIEWDISIAPNETVKIPTGIAIHIADTGYCALILPRSGLGSKGIVLGNTIGLIDSDYQGELILSILNRGTETYLIKAYERLAQLVFVPITRPTLEFVEEFSVTTERGDKGFGSTGST
jgi:dUTP pyrophosphatase